MRIARTLPACCSVVLALFNPAWAYGPEGHQTIGVIADLLLAGSRAGAEVKSLLGGQTLREVAVWADCAKGIDPHKGYAYTEEGQYRDCKVFETPAGEAEMADFVRRNDTNCDRRPSEESCHKQYHYTDVAIQHSDYNPRFVGTRPDDLVQATRAAILVLQGQPAPAPFAFKDQREALRVLAHYIGDLHQPLHVGSVYLSPAGKRVNPDQGTYDDHTDTVGGNRLILAGITTKLHALWDDVPAALTVSHVDKAMLDAARAVPKNRGPVAGWPARYATDTLGAAKLAFKDLTFAPAVAKTWAVTRPADYTARRSAIQRQQIIKAGARFAAILQAIWPDGRNAGPAPGP